MNINENHTSSLSQTKKILAHLQEGKSITPLEALNMFGCFRLGARIADIKALGYAVRSEFVTTPLQKRVKKYYL